MYYQQQTNANFHDLESNAAKRVGIVHQQPVLPNSPSPVQQTIQIQQPPQQVGQNDNNVNYSINPMQQQQQQPYNHNNLLNPNQAKSSTQPRLDESQPTPHHLSPHHVHHPHFTGYDINCKPQFDSTAKTSNLNLDNSLLLLSSPQLTNLKLIFQSIRRSHLW